MKITDIKIRKLTDSAKMKAVVSVTFDDELVIHDIKVIAGYDKMIDTLLMFGYAEARDLMQKAYNVQHHLPEDFGMNIE